VRADLWQTAIADPNLFRCPLEHKQAEAVRLLQEQFGVYLGLSGNSPGGNAGQRKA
jgi:hypothetical protein